LRADVLTLLQSSICVPASTLFDPIGNSEICPLGLERWELRTKALGCGCSTTTLLAILITIVCTIVGLFVLYGVWIVLKWVNRIWGPGSYGGWYLEIDDNGSKTEGVWIRRRWWQPTSFYQSDHDTSRRRGERQGLLS